MRAPGPLPLLLLPLGVVALLGFSIAQSPLRAAPDAAIYMEIGQLLLDGRRPYVDFIETNPPLIMYLNVLPALLARLSGLHAIAVFNAAVLALIAWSTWAARRQLVASRIDAFELAPALVAAAWAGLSLFLWLGSPWDVNDFGQREHLFVLLWLPYALLRCRRGGGSHGAPAPAAALGVAAAIGVCFKPHFLVVLLAAEAALIATRRQARIARAPEVLGLAAVGLLYGAHFAFLPQEVRDAFFGRWLPFVANHYWIYAREDARAFDPAFVGLAGFGLAAALVAQRRSRRETPCGGLLASVGVFTAAAVGAYYWQGKGFPYQRIPALAAGVVLGGVALSLLLSAVIARLRRVRAQTLAIGAVALLGWGALVAAAPLVAPRSDHGNGALSPFARVTRAYAEDGEPIAILSLSAWPEYPTLVQLGRRQSSRFLSLVYLPLAFAAREAGDGGQAERQILGELAADLRARQPPFIAVYNRGCTQCVEGSLIHHLAANPEMRAVLDGYRQRRSFGLPQGTRLLVRADRADRDPATTPWVYDRP